MSNQDKQLQKLTELIQRLVDNPVAPVAPVQPVAPVLPILPQNNGDHDILQRLDEKVKIGFEDVQKSIKELKDGTKATVDDHEKRIKELEACKIEPTEHKSVLASMNTNNIYLKLLLGAIIVLIGIMSWHIIGIRII